MVHILLDGITLAADYLREALGEYIRPHHRITCVAFPFHEDKIQTPEDWDRSYGPEKGNYYAAITDSFAPFGIPKERVTFVNYFRDTPETAAEKIRSADIVYFPGGLPDRMMDRIRQFRLEEVLAAHEGVMMGFSAGAMIQFAEYHISPDKDYPEFCWRRGLPCLEGLYLEVHYEGSEEQKQAIRQVLRERQKTVYATAFDRGAIILDGGELRLLGDVRRFAPGDQII